MEVIYYVYSIRNITNNKLYIGSRRTKILPVNDIGFKYFSSSTDKNFILDQKINRSNYEYDVIRLFDNSVSMLDFESTIHHLFNVDTNPDFYNKAIQYSSKFQFCSIGKRKPLSLEHKQAISRSNKGKKRTPESIQATSKKLTGTKRPDHVKQAMRDRRQNVTFMFNEELNIRKLINVEDISKYEDLGYKHVYGAREEEIINKSNKASLNIEVYTDQDILFFKGNTSQFKQKCIDEDIPFELFRKSYRTKTKIYDYDLIPAIHSKITNNGRIKYKQWYCINIDTRYK